MHTQFLELWSVSEHELNALLIGPRIDRRQVTALELQFDRLGCCAVTLLVGIEKFLPGAILGVVQNVVTPL